MQGTVTTSVQHHIATITFTHPAHNSMPGHQLAELTRHIHQAGESPEINVVVLKSGGDRTFCAGANFDELMAIRTADEGKQFFLGFAHVINAIRTCPKIVLGRVQGKAIGGGVGLAAAVDYCMATTYGSIKLSELALGIGPFVVGPAIERKVGLSAFSQLALNATEWQTATWAREKGLYHDVFEGIEQLDAYVEHFARKLAETSPAALRALKQVLWQGTGHWDQLLDERAAISGRLVITEAAQALITAARTA